MATKILPLLITRDIVVLPNTETQIEAGREKSVLIAELYLKDEKKHNEIVIATQIDGLVEDPIFKDIYKEATLCEITNVIKSPTNHAFTIIVKGISRVKLSSMDNEKTKYYSCNYGLTKELNVLGQTISPNIAELKKIINDENVVVNNDVRKKAIKMFDDSHDTIVLIDQLTHLFTNYDFVHNKKIRHDILSEQNFGKRIVILTNFIKIDSISDGMKKEIDNFVNKKVNETLSNQQKEYYLKEKIRVVKDELGKINPKENDISGYRNLLESNPYPENIRIKVESELAKIEGTGFSQENAISKAYIEWLLNMPYWQVTKDNNDIKHVQKILDDSHFGLEKIKERIVEYLAILARNPKGKSPILCLVGPPGVGKTSLAKSIAVALNKKFIKVALGGVHDESEIRGHRRTYLGSMPGRIIKGIRQAGVINPIILLDEIDKMSNDGQHGDPGNALLEVLDPEQNTMFNDNYIEENYDLSNVLFIATANYIEQIPEPLHDRLEIIELTTYTELEKLSIAKNYLTKRIEEYTAITTKQLHFTDDGIKFIINHYTREAGVRELERQMNKIARKFAIKLQADEKLVLKVTTDVVREYLGKIIYEYNVKDKIALPGIVNGMAYTSAGGDLLPLEVTYFDGKGDITITGNLKETMKESAQVALGYVRTNAVGFGISKDFDFSKINIHIHVPNGGVPKDGPSAGVALTTALISSLTKRPVSTHIAMTGEIMLRGKVGIIGGVREKVISAFRAGVNEIFLPKDDERYLDDVPKEIKKEITFHLVENYLEIYNLVFNKKILPVNIKDKLRKN